MTAEIEIISSIRAWSEERREQQSRYFRRRMEGSRRDVIVVKAKFGDYEVVLAFSAPPNGEPLFIGDEGQECPISEEGLEEVRNYLRPHFAKMRKEIVAS